MNKKHYDKIINKIMSDNIDVTNRIINFTASQISVLYIKELTDSSSLSLEVIKPLIENKNILNVNVKTAMDKIIFSSDCKIESDRVKIEDYILQGMTVILFSNDNRYIVINLKKIAHRTVSNPELNYTLRGPKDCFIENLDTNLSLIRYRLKDKNLRIDYQKVGKRTKARVAVIYFEDIANNKIVSEVKKRIEKVNIDGIIESGELQAFLLNRKSNFFPQMGIAERSDMACGALLEGKVVTLVEGSDLALIAPKVLSEFLWSCDDIYDNKYAGFFHRIIRVIALMLSLTAPAMYVAIVSFHNDILPSDYIIAISQARAKVPFNAVIEVLLIEIIVALLVVVFTFIA